MSKWTGLVLVLAMTGGCKSDDDKTCTPGAQVACDCPSGAKSVQVCNSEGAGLGACQCGGAPGSELGVRPGDGGGPTGDGGGPCAWPGSQTGERFLGHLLLDLQENLYITHANPSSSNYHYPTRIDCRTGQITEQMIPFDPGWSSGKAVPIKLQLVGDHFLVSFAPQATEQPSPEGPLVLYDGAWQQVASIVPPGKGVYVDPKDSTFYVVGTDIKHYDKSGKLLASYPFPPECYPTLPAPDGMYCFAGSNQVPKLFKEGQVSDIPALSDLASYYDKGSDKAFRILGQDDRYGLLISYGQVASSSPPGWFKIELRDPAGTIAWTSTQIDHSWGDLVIVPFVHRAHMDPAGDVIVVGGTKTGLPGKPAASDAYFMIKFSRASTMPLWSYQSPDFHDPKQFVPVPVSSVMTSRGELIHAASEKYGLKMFDSAGNEVGPRF